MNENKRRNRRVFGKLARMATLALKNGVRLHEDAVLLFMHDRVPSAQQESILSMEEIGKYFLLQEVYFQDGIVRSWCVDHIQDSLRMSFDHVHKHGWFARHGRGLFVPKPILDALSCRRADTLKQRSTYVGLPRLKKRVDISGKISNPLRISRKQTEQYITAVNDFLMLFAVGIRTGWLILDIDEVNVWLSEEETENYLRSLWPKMSGRTAARITTLKACEASRPSLQ